MNRFNNRSQFLQRALGRGQLRLHPRALHGQTDPPDLHKGDHQFEHHAEFGNRATDAHPKPLTKLWVATQDLGSPAHGHGVLQTERSDGVLQKLNLFGGRLNEGHPAAPTQKGRGDRQHQPGKPRSRPQIENRVAGTDPIPAPTRQGVQEHLFEHLAAVPDP